MCVDEDGSLSWASRTAIQHTTMSWKFLPHVASSFNHRWNNERSILPNTEMKNMIKEENVGPPMHSYPTKEKRSQEGRRFDSRGERRSLLHHCSTTHNPNDHVQDHSQGPYSGVVSPSSNNREEKQSLPPQTLTNSILLQIWAQRLQWLQHQ